MLKTGRFNIHIFFLGMLFMLPTSGSVYAGACSPGIPCTGYDIYNNKDSGVNTSYNGRKSGAPSPYTNNANSTVSACDGNFMNQIYSRAFMEASREVIMSEQLIHRPDSVLEYTCFDQRISVAANQAGPIFSESKDWEDIDIELWTGGPHEGGGSRGSHDHTSCSGTCRDDGDFETINDTGATDGIADQDEYSVFADDRLDTVLEELLFDNLEDYIDDNFDHTFLGEASTIDNTMDMSFISSNNYSCSHMMLVWQIAKCIDFGEDDRFRSFEHLVNSDPRSIPEACSPSNISSDAVEQGDSATKLDNTDPGDQNIIGGMPSGGLTTKCPAAGAPAITVTTNPPSGTGFSNDLIRISNNCDDGTNMNAYSSFDIVKSHTGLIKGFGIYNEGAADSADSNVITVSPTTTVSCADPIPTGVPVYTYKYTTFVNANQLEIPLRTIWFHYDHICPNTGCFYQAVPVLYTLGSALPTSSTGTCLPIY